LIEARDGKPTLRLQRQGAAHELLSLTTSVCDTVTNSTGLTVPAGMVWRYFRKILRKFVAYLNPNFRKILRKSNVGPLSLRKRFSGHLRREA
jgi:hypothetical protein